MENESKYVKEQNTPLKVAELATIIYAILVLMSLILDNAYYAQFNIPIVSYMSGSEILLSCVQQMVTPTMMVFAICIACTLVLMPIVYRMFLGKPFLPNEAIPSHDQITAKYNTSSVLILTVYFIVSVFIYIEVLDMMIFGMLFGTVFYLYCVFPNFVPKYFEKYINRLSDNVLRHHKERFYDINYRYRIHILVFACLLSMFFILLKMQYRKADDVKQNGAGVCVILEGDGIDIDTREGTIDYIGECAGTIFLYDRETQGTIIYERSQIRHYKLITDYIAKANVKYDRYAEHVQSENRHVGTTLLQRINEELPLAPVFTFAVPDNYVLTHQDNNYFVWEDTVAHTYIEQLNIPKRLFDHMPMATDIFNLDIYVADERSMADNYLLCSTTLRTFTGKGHELVQTIIGDGDHYTAWLFYDPTGQHTNVMPGIYQSMHLKGNVWQQMVTIYHTHKTLWMIIFILTCITCFSCFLNGWIASSSMYIIIVTFCTIAWPLVIYLSALNRWQVLLTFVGLAVAAMIVSYLLGLLISKSTKKTTNPTKSI